MKTFQISRSLVFCCATALVLGFAWTPLSAEEPTTKENGSDEQKAGAEPDPYAVPDGDASALIEFIEKVESIRPSSQSEYIEILQKRPPAVLAAVDRILSGKPTDAQVLTAVKAKLSSLRMLGYVDPTAQDKIKQFVNSLSKNKVPGVAEVVFQFDLVTRVRRWERLSADAKAKVQSDLIGLLSRTKFAPEQVGLAVQVAQAIENMGDPAEASAMYSKLATAFLKSNNEKIIGLGKSFEPMIRRLNLPGNPIEINGSLLDGSTFDWPSYKGKVVLVDFWATWCGPCVQELPNVVANYELYHDKGFDVVGISLDSDKSKVQEFVDNRKIPWAILYSDDPRANGWNHPTAVYYGIAGIPTVILVNQQGKVVSLNARGPELGKQLEKLLGKAEAVDDPANSQKAEGKTKS